MCQPITSHQTTATVLFNQQLTERQLLLRLDAPKAAEEAEPGHFIHLNCHPNLTLPRPFSILDADPKEGTLDIFYQVVGEGTTHMAGWQPGLQTTLLGPIGHGFKRPDPTRHALLIAGGIGYAPLDFFARRLRQWSIETTLLLGLEADPPFELMSASAPLSFEATENPLALRRLEDLQIPSRLSSLQNRPGFFPGYVTQLATEILQNMSEEKRRNTDLYTCGPTPMMKAAAQVATEFNLGGQASLEESMACGFGGCAGCVAPIRESDESWNYRRVCTDGPVFSLSEVMWDKVG